MRAWLPVLLCWALPQLPALAQEAPGSEPESGANGPGAGEPETAPGGGAELPSPGDYRASEQISDDLSVSFPVDI